MTIPPAPPARPVGAAAPDGSGARWVDRNEAGAECVAAVEIQISRSRAGRTVISVAGEIDLATWAAFDDAVLGAVATAVGDHVVLDLDQVRFLGACAIASLLTAQHHAWLGGGSMTLMVGDSVSSAAALRAARIDSGPNPTPALTPAGGSPA